MHRLAVVLAALIVSGCAIDADQTAAVCDGKHRRPANLYGSILPDAPLDIAGGSPLINPPPAGQAPNMPSAAPSRAPPARAKPLPRAAADRQSSRPCGRLS